MPEYLLEGLRNTAIYRSAHATALIYIAMWCDEYRGGVYPDQLLPEARLLAPKVKGVRDAEALLLLLASRANDPILLDLLRKNYPTLSEETWKDIVEKTVGASPRQTLTGSLPPVLDLMPATPTFL